MKVSMILQYKLLCFSVASLGLSCSGFFTCRVCYYSCACFPYSKINSIIYCLFSFIVWPYMLKKYILNVILLWFPAGPEMHSVNSPLINESPHLFSNMFYICFTALKVLFRSRQ